MNIPLEGIKEWYKINLYFIKYLKDKECCLSSIHVTTDHLEILLELIPSHKYMSSYPYQEKRSFWVIRRMFCINYIILGYKKNVLSCTRSFCMCIKANLDAQVCQVRRYTAPACLKWPYWLANCYCTVFALLQRLFAETIKTEEIFSLSWKNILLEERMFWSAHNLLFATSNCA